MAVPPNIVTLEAGWAVIQAGIDHCILIFEEEAGQDKIDAEEYMTLYSTVYNMCTQKPPHDYNSQLYARFKEILQAYIARRVLPALRELRDEALLKELCRRWGLYKGLVKLVSHHFNYLDRFYVTRFNVACLRDVGWICFRDAVYTELKAKASEALLRMIEREREGELVDQALIKNALDIFVAVGMGSMACYEREFEEQLLSETSAFYRRKAGAWIEQDSCPDYMLKAEEHIKLEEARADAYLHSSTKAKLLEQVVAELLASKQEALLNKEHSGCAVLLRDDKTDDLARLCRLFSRIPKGLDPVADTFKRHVESEGNKLVKEVTEEVQSKKEKEAGKGPSKDAGTPAEQRYVRSSLELHNKYLAVVSQCFSNVTLFHKALKEAFESFLNKSVAGSSSAELLASFCDNLLKKGGAEKLTDEEVDETLDKVVKLLAFISDKDMFAEFYSKKLSRRLLNDKSLSDDHERSILSRLKQQFGHQFTTKMEGMVTDLQLARDKQVAFKEWATAQGKALPIDMSVRVLTTGFWPTYKATELALPKEMADGVELFTRFYELGVPIVDGKPSRRLAWMYSLGNCMVKGNFDAKPIEMSMTTTQAALCMLFNDVPELTYAEIRERLTLQDDEVERLLHSLSCAKYKILIKEPAGKNVNRTDKFMLNTKFTDKMRRIAIPAPPTNDKPKVLEDVEKGRANVIDAAIVRTMKSRKALQYQQLVMEVVQQLQRMFKPDFKLIKKRIEDLVSREYLERDSEDPQLFKYLA